MSNTEFEAVKRTLFVLKELIVCGCLLAVLVNSCDDKRKTTDLTNEVIRLQSVVENSLPIDSYQCVERLEGDK